MSIRTSPTQTESIIDLYKKINEKGSLADGLALNDRAQMKLKTINTIRLLPLEFVAINRAGLLFNISLKKMPVNEEVKLIEFRLKLKDRSYRKRLTFILRQGMSQRQRFRPLIISREGNINYSTTIRDKNVLQQASLVIYSRTPGVFLLPSPTRRTRRSISTGPCSRHDLFVDFNQLSFGAWVVEPKRFNAGICRGDCPNPLSRLFYPTNHAMLLSLLHDRGNAIQQPSCVPVRLRPLDLLYYDRRELVIKRHRGMQVEECGCR